MEKENLKIVQSMIPGNHIRTVYGYQTTLTLFVLIALPAIIYTLTDVYYAIVYWGALGVSVIIIKPGPLCIRQKVITHTVEIDPEEIKNENQLTLLYALAARKNGFKKEKRERPVIKIDGPYGNPRVTVSNPLNYN